MLKFFDKLVDKVEGHVFRYIDQYLDSDMKPQLREAIEQLVREFRATVIDKVPQTVGRSLQDDDDSHITGMVSKALADKLEKLLERLLTYFGPEVERATSSLTDTITDQTMMKAKAFLNLERAVPAQAASEPGTRAFNLPGVGNVDFSQTIGKYLGLEKRLPTLEKDLRENFQPIAKLLHNTLWDKFLQVLNAVLNEMFPWLKLPVSRDLVLVQQQDRGWFSDRVEDVQEMLKKKISAHLPELYEALKEPVGEIIAGMVKWLEDKSVSTAVVQVHDVVKDLDLVKVE